jgi:hypothetical protein
MSAYQYTSDLLADVLFRSGELLDGSSDRQPAAIQFLNRAYNSVCMGGGEFNDEINEEWWWLHKDPPGVLVLEPPYKVGTVSVTNNSSAILFDAPVAASRVGWFFRAEGHADVFRVLSHTAGSAAMVLDSVYTGLTAGIKTYQLFKLEYNLPADVYRITDSMQVQNGYGAIVGVELSTMNRDYPLSQARMGIPDQFANVTETKIRFNRCGIDTNGSLVRVEYDYLFRPTPLINAVDEEPVVPRQYRQILADIAYFYILQSKSNGSQEQSSQLSQAGAMIKRGMRAMCNEQHHRMVVHGNLMGTIQPRLSSSLRNRWPLRTESGHIIG